MELKIKEHLQTINVTFSKFKNCFTHGFLIPALQEKMGQSTSGVPGQTLGTIRDISRYKRIQW